MKRMSFWAVLLPMFVFIISPLFSQTRFKAVTDSLHRRSSSKITSSDFYQKSYNSQPRVPKASPNITDTGFGRLNQSEVLTPFGFDLFAREGFDVASMDAGILSLPANYQLGPGDRIGIYLLGTVQENIDVMVNVEGKIFLPPVGVLHVWGLNMDEFKTLLNKKLARYYDNFALDVMLLKAKNVIVAVVGDVVRPGKYVLSALNTVLDAVIMAGGPTPNGSIRGIQLMRRDSLITTVDLYRFLMAGDNDEDAFLEAADKIYVPLAKHRVAISGEVRRASLFELKPSLDERLSDLILLAGGFTDHAYQNKIEVSRLEENGERTLEYVDFRYIAEGDSVHDIHLRNEDRVKIYSRQEQTYRRSVSIFGEIRRPGEYPLENNMHLSDLILKAGNLTRKAYTLEAEVAKVDPQKSTVFMKVSLQKMSNGTNGKNDILLDDDDQVFIRRIPDWEVGLTVEIQGEAKFPGMYSIVKDSTYLSEIMRKAGGFTDEAFLQEAHVIRPSTQTKFDKEFERLQNMRREEMTNLEYQYFVMRQNSSNIEELVVDFSKLFEERDVSEDIILEDRDIIVIPKAPRVVMITGSVARPGGVTFTSGKKLDYYLAKAGGASWDAKLGKTKVIKVTGEVLDDEKVKDFEPGDIIWVPRRSDKRFWPSFLQTVTVLSQIASIYLIIDRAVAN